MLNAFMLNGYLTSLARFFFKQVRYFRFQLIALLFFGTMGCLTVLRSVLVLTADTSFGNVGTWMIIVGFYRGLTFDMVIASELVTLLVLFFLVIPPVLDRTFTVRLLVSVYTTFVFAVLLVSSIADYMFFQKFGTRLDKRVIQYIQYDYVWKIILQRYHMVPIVAILLIVCFVVGFYTYRYVRLRTNPDTGVSLVGNLALFFVVLVLLVPGNRGSIGRKPINSGPAYFSSSNELAQVTLNGLFSLRESVYSHFVRGRSVDKLYRTIPEEEARKIVKRLYSGPDTSFVSGAENPLLRDVRSDRPRNDYNVVLVVMESMGWRYFEDLGGMKNLTPNLDRLIRNGLLLENCFAGGTRTTRGFAGLISGFPDLPGESVTTRESSVGHMLTLGEILRRRGYDSMFVYAGQPYYDHRQSYLGSNGFNKFVFRESFPQKTFRSPMGWSDEDLFAAAHHTFTRQEKPFFATLLTLSFHEPYTIPKGRIESAYPGHPHEDSLKAIQYTDWAVGQFLRKARKSNYFEDTIFVFTADHMGGFLDRDPKPTAHRVPVIIYAPEIIGIDGRVISQICSQTDVAPTILDLLGGTYRHGFFGSSVLSRPREKEMALLQNGSEVLTFINGDHYMVRIPPHRKKSNLLKLHLPDKITPVPRRNEKHRKLRSRLRRQALSILQTASTLFENKTYQLK